MLTTPQIIELLRIIEQHADQFLISVFGTEAVSESSLKELIAAGLIPPSIDPEIFKHAYALGKLKAILTASQYKSLKFSELKKLMKLKWSVVAPLTSVEKLRIRSAEQHSVRGIRNIAKDIQDGIFAKLQEEQEEVLTEATIEQYIKDEVITAIKFRDTVSSLASALPRKLKTHSRDWLRVASTELHKVRQWGTADAIMRGVGAYSGFDEDPEDSRVFVQPTKGACEECKEAYLDKNGIPKIFKLSDLIANGTNIGVPKKQRKPVVPPHHPLGLCEMNYIPPGHEFNDKGELYLADPEALYGDIAKLKAG